MPAPTDAAVIEAFRADYLYTGNASKSGRKVGLDPVSACRIARRLQEDPEFIKDCRKVRDQEMRETLAARRQVRRIALKRFKSKTGGIDVKRFKIGKNENVTITDRRHEYGKLILDAERNAIALYRVDAEKAGDLPTERDIKIVFAAIKQKDKPKEATPGEGEANG